MYKRVATISVSALNARLLKGVGANTVSQVINISIQLLSLPIFLTVWDVNTYGNWLLIITIPAYLSMADAGIANVISNKMTMEAGNGNFLRANQLYQEANKTVALLLAGILTAFTTVLLLCQKFIPENFQGVELAILGLLVVATLHTSLLQGIFKATHRYSYWVYSDVAAKLIEWFGAIIGLVWGGGYFEVAFGMLAGRFVGIAMQYIIAFRGVTEFSFGFKTSSWAETSKTLKLSASFMLLPISNALNIQGVSLIVGATLGPSTLAVFNTLRTLSRLVVQAASVITHSAWPEFSYSYGKRDSEGIHVLYKRVELSTALLALSAVVFVFVFSEYIVEFWTLGKISFDSRSMSYLLLYGLVGSCWHAPRIFLIATNNFSRIAHIYLTGTIGLLALLFAISPSKLETVCLWMLVSELVFFAASRNLVTKKIKEMQ